MKNKPRFRQSGKLVGLSGMPPRVPGWAASSRTEMVRVLKAKRACHAAGDSGAITVWRPKDGIIRAEFSRWMSVKSSQAYTSVAELRDWLKTWWPRMENQ